MKRTLSALASLALLAPAAAAQPLTNSGPPPAAAPFSETVHGDRVDDPWRWMESPERTGDVAAFIRRASDHSTSQLAALPGRARLRARVDAATQAGVRYSDLEQAGGSLFYRRTDPGAQLAKLVVRSPGGRERVLHDPEAGGTRGPAINSYSVSPDGAFVALHTASGGAEMGAIHFIDVASGRILPDRLEPVWGEFEVAWLDATTFTYTRMMPAAAGANPMHNTRAFIRRLGSTAERPLLGAGVDGGPRFEPHEFPFVGISGDSEWALGFGNGARADGRLLVARRADTVAGRPVWRAIADYPDEVQGADVIGDRLLMLTTRNAPSGAIVALDLSRSQTLGDARVIVPARDDLILSSFAASAAGLYVLGQTDGISRLFFLANGARTPVELQLPLRGLIANLRDVEGGAGVTFQIQDWFTAPRWFHANGRRVTSLRLDSASYAGIRGARRVREAARSADRTSVPLDVLLPANFRPGTPVPLLVEAYGGYGVSIAEPYYASDRFGLIEEGGAVAYCGTRGGGERGRAWHEGGRSANKPNAHADLIACGERLVELGYTRPELMTVLGTSAGGLLSPPAALRRPDLFGALVANVAILNPTRLAAAENGANQFGEMGDPNEEAGYRA
ncbi:MAG TPA: prolyl oligopeptidase family serine peptidase, partial [Allosphingosinicella sp.]